MAFFGSGYFGQGFTPADILFAQQNQQQPTAGSFQAPQQPTGSFFGSNPNLAQTGGLLSLLGTDGQQEKQGQSQQGGIPSTTSASASGSFFGGKREPSFEEQEREYSSIRDQVMKDPGSAALLAGLSILSANRPRNGRTPSLGELVGAGGLGMIQGLGQMQQAQDVRERERQLSQYRGLQMENIRGSMADAQRKREAMARLQEPGGWTEENIAAAFPELNVQNRYRREADERDYQQRLDMLNRQNAFQRSLQDARLSAENRRNEYKYVDGLGFVDLRTRKVLPFLDEYGEPILTPKQKKETAEADKLQLANEEKKKQAIYSARTAVGEIGNALALIGNPKDINWNMGLTGSLLRKLPGSSANDLQASLDTIGSGVMLDRLQALKEASPTGASGMGQLSNQEGKILRDAQGSLSLNQSPEQLRRNLNRILDIQKEMMKSWGYSDDEIETIFKSSQNDKKKSPSGDIKSLPDRLNVINYTDIIKE